MPTAESQQKRLIGRSAGHLTSLRIKRYHCLIFLSSPLTCAMLSKGNERKQGRKERQYNSSKWNIDLSVTLPTLSMIYIYHPSGSGSGSGSGRKTSQKERNLTAINLRLHLLPWFTALSLSLSVCHILSCVEPSTYYNTYYISQQDTTILPSRSIKFIIITHLFTSFPISKYTPSPCKNSIITIHTII